jgi:hypothetical protein
MFTKPGPRHPVEPVQFRFFTGALPNAKLMAKLEESITRGALCRSGL